MQRRHAGKHREAQPGGRRSPRTDPRVASYLGAIGLGGIQERSTFWGRLKERHGAIAEAVARAIAAREAGEDVDIYPLKNASLDLSIDVTAQYCGEMVPAFLDWFLREGFRAPRVLVDAGCDNGILTCFYAGLYPEADVVGIDRCAEGIACARELAGRLRLPNVRFEGRDLEALAGVLPGASVDCIVSAAVFHEVLVSPGDRGERPGDAEAANVVADLAALLRKESGTWISMERWPDAATLTWWIGHLRRAGLRVETERSTGLAFPGLEQEWDLLPIVVATRGRPLADRAAEARLVDRIYGEIDDAPPGRGDPGGVGRRAAGLPGR